MRRMFDRRCSLPLVVGLCLAAAGCQGEAPASATGPAGSQPLSGLAPATAAPGGEAASGPAAKGIRPPPPVPNDDRVIPITFDDLQLEMKEDSVFAASLLTPRVRQLDGQRVRIRGFIFPAVFQQTGITRFPLVKNTQCKFGPGGLAHHVILVDLQPGLSTSFTVRPIAVEGRLTVRPFDGPDGKAWAVYHLAGEKVN